MSAEQFNEYGKKLEEWDLSINRGILTGKTTKSTLKDQIDNHQKLEKASSTLNDNKCTLTFDKNGKCTAITETIA